MNGSLTAKTLVWVVPGLMLGLFLSSRLLRWLILVLTIVAPGFGRSLSIKSRPADRIASWFVVLIHPVPIALAAAIVLALYSWPQHLGAIGRGFWFGVLLGGISMLFLMAVLTFNYSRKRRAAETSRLLAASGGESSTEPER